MERRDEIILKKVLSEISVASSMMSCSFSEFNRNEMLKRAVCMTVINIGELVKNLSEDCKKLDRSIPLEGNCRIP